MKGIHHIRICLKAFDGFTAALKRLSYTNYAAAFRLAAFARKAGKVSMVMMLAEYAIRHYEQAGPWAEIVNRKNKINWI